MPEETTRELAARIRGKRKHYKIILNAEIVDPEMPHPAGGSYTHDNRLQGVIRSLLASVGYEAPFTVVTLDKVIDKSETPSRPTLSLSSEEISTLILFILLAQEHVRHPLDRLPEESKHLIESALEKLEAYEQGIT